MSDLNQHRLLLMEDNETFAHMFSRRMRHEGYLVDIALDGPRGISMVQKGDYLLLVIDHGLPGLSGLDVIRLLKEKGFTHPIIMLTSTGNEQLSVEALQLGVDDYIVKDANLACLKLFPVVLQRVLERRRQQQQENLQRQQIIADKALLEAAVLNIGPDGMLLIGPTGVIYQANHVIAHILGYNPAELLGQSFEAFIRLQGVENQQQWLEDLIRRIGCYQGPAAVITRRGEELPLRLHATFLPQQLGAVIMIRAEEGWDTDNLAPAGSARRMYYDAERCLDDAIGRLNDWAQAVQQVAGFKNEMRRILDEDIRDSLNIISEFGQTLAQQELKHLNRDQVQRLVASCQTVHALLDDFAQKVEADIKNAPPEATPSS